MTIPETRKIEDGEIVTAPGIYAMSLGWYHQDCADGPSISSSGLNTMWSQSPAHYWVTSALNPKRIERPRKPEFDFGSAAHHLLLLGRKGFDKQYALRPDKWSSWRTDAAQAWKVTKEKEGFTVITVEDLENIAGMAAALAAHPVIKEGALDGLVERSLIWTDPETGVWVKSRPDAIPTDDGVFSDLKTTTSVSDDNLQRSIGNFGYHAQAALIGQASKHVMNVDMESFSLIFVEKAPPWCVRVITLRDDDLERGAGQNRAMVHRFKECIATGVWPGPGDDSDAELMGMQPYLQNRIDARLGVVLPEIEQALYDDEQMGDDSEDQGF
jgi:hypothetical protein